MRFKAIPAPLIVLLLITLSVAQTKISGTSKCGQPDQQQKIEIGDEPNHAFAISQGKCAWTKPMDTSGIQTKEDVATGSDEISGASARAHGFVVGTMSNGDKFHVRTQGTDTYKARKRPSFSRHVEFCRGYRETEGHQRQRHLQGQTRSRG